MPSIVRLQPRAVLPLLYRSALSAPTRRTYAAQTSKKTEGERDTANQNPGAASNDTHDNYPIPSNKAHPTLRDGRQSPMADMDGHLRTDLPEDVKQHNEEVEQRHDRPYNHMGDQGSVEHPFERK